ncbi:steroidogenic acute regulatory protein-like [Phlebotomus papatasi]|uniref:steroidogenic acute regulatory protein-like n=1 Tax=Phlebotomus papatasi TaxID=29031 RepID=UPI0024845206|nr:steroidogenic acute regulatory protein-like [Phlebotomus papatasi]XP_055702020.1 steroidogenic acute regulatory protein-like [Phlebotomus papatasi]XP_055702021.1 steroidogenic acute regulatory protein-like [Phlebotomus papatasi]XP_055702022.1 steroidogenic acute regulatory protein-like [Phlebotomus papatasi]XP_055702023.1 steroidogenic acute regulatory protein-like [Phlebotomus papatasi]
MAQRGLRDVMYERQYPSLEYIGNRSQSHSINLITEDFISGYQHDGRMSVIRRFFCLFVTFDLVFIALLWLICVMITGDNIYNALRTQVVHYTIYTSLFDIVMAAICRFVVLILFYAILYINHWIIIAASTSGSCAFLISKVFVYNWADSPEPVFQVLLIVISFVIAWGEAWFLDCRVIPQEQHAQSYLNAISSTFDDRGPLLAPFLATSTGTGRRTESIANFYSPYESIHNSDDEGDKDEEYKRMALECVKKAYELLESEDWEVEKVTPSSDTIQSIKRDRLGKVYKLTGRVNSNAKKLVEDLFINIEEMPKWNPTLLDSRVIHRIDPRTDISYQVSAPGGGGFVKSRDFVNLRSWETFENGRMIQDDEESELYPRGRLPTVQEQSEGESSVKSEPPSKPRMDEAYQKRAPMSLSKSLGARDFSASPSIAEQEEAENEIGDVKFQDAEDWPNRSLRVYVSAAVAIEYPGFGATTKYVRGENLISCVVTREIPGEENCCIYEWLLCLDLKGYIPKSILETAYTTLMQDYMKYLRSHCNEISKQKH